MITKEIIDKYIAGKKDGFDAIYSAYAPGMFSICLRYTRCEDDAKDVLQEAFIRIHQQREKYDPSKEIGPWIKTITIRTALNYIKSNYRLSLTDDDKVFDSTVNQDEKEASGVDLKSKLMSILAKLPEGYRTVFTLFTVDNLTHKEIAEYLGITEGTSKSQYSKAKKMVKELLQTEKMAS